MLFPDGLYECARRLIMNEATDPSGPVELSTPEIIACIIIHQGGQTSPDRLGIEAMRYFDYFNQKIIEQSYSISAVSLNLRAEIMDNIRAYDFDFLRHEPVSIYGARYSLSQGTARMILRERLQPPTPVSHHAVNHFGGLPAELKKTIYEYVLLLPTSGVMVYEDLRKRGQLDWDERNKRVKSMVVLSRDPAAKMRIAEWPSLLSLRHPDPPAPFISANDIEHNPTTFTVPFPNLLDILAVNHEFHSQCAEIFYGKNRFHAPGFAEWHALLADLAPARARLLRRVSLRYTRHDSARAAAVFAQLRGLGVASVALLVDRAEWAGVVRPNILGLQTWFAVGGMRELCAMDGGGEILIEGDWEEFARFVRRESGVREVAFNGVVVGREE